MSINGGLNKIRRVIIHALTSVIVQRDKNTALSFNDIERILVCRPNGRLGNQILISPLLQELAAIFPHSKIDLFVKGNLSETLFCNYPDIDKIIKLPAKPFKNLSKYIRTWFELRKYKYDMVINVTGNSSSGRLSTRFVNAGIRLFSADEDAGLEYPDHKHIAKAPVYSLRNYSKNAGVDREKEPVPDLNLKLSEAEKAHGREILDNLFGNGKKTIAIYTFATGDKCYSKPWWEKVYERLKKEYGEKYNILEILPKENVSQIDFAEPSFYSLDLREICAVISNTAVFIGADSGMMHLASAANIPTLGLFSITDTEVYAPYNNGSCAVDTTQGIDRLFEALDIALS